MATSEQPSRTSSRARAAVSAFFLANGATLASVVPRYPELKESLVLSNAALGSAIAAFPFGALIAGVLASVVMNRWGSARVAVAGIAVGALALAAISVVPNWWWLAATLFVAGGVDAIADVANNAHGMRVQRRYGRSILNSFHGLWSVGAVLGGLFGSAAAGAAIPLPVHLCCSAAALMVIALVGSRHLLAGPDDAEREPSAEASGRNAQLGRAALVPLVGLGVLAASAAVIEDSGASWGAVYLAGSLGAAPAIAGLAFVALQGMQTVGRLLGDRVVSRFGDRAVARAGGTLATLGLGTALVLPSVPGTIAGFAVAGLGGATLMPAVMHAADEIPGIPSGAGLTVVTWISRMGFLLAPPLIGVLADAYSLRLALGLVPLAGIGVVLLAVTLRARRRVAVLAESA